MLSYLPTPAWKNGQNSDSEMITGRTYYRLGKNRPGSGIRGLSSNSALIFHVIVQIPSITSDTIAVFIFQFAGCAYQPPAGDQTCLGYLSTDPESVAEA